MGIKIEHNRYGSCPIIVCDHCQKQIVDAEEGSYLFDMPLYAKGNHQVDVLFAHRRCFDHLEKRMEASGCDLVGDIPLEAFSVYLERNLKLNRKRAVTTANALSDGIEGV